MPEDLIREQKGLPVNLDGEILAVAGTGGRTLAGSINAGDVPVDNTGKAIINFRNADGAEPVFAKVNQSTGFLEYFVGEDVMISYGTDFPVDADGKPNGAIYFQI